MDVFEIVGLVVLLLALFSPLLKRIFERRDKKRHPEEYARRQREREEQSREVLRQIFGEEPPKGVEIEPEFVPPPPPEELKYEPSVPQDAYRLRETKTSKVAQLVKREGVLQEMVILHEILAPPVSLRE